ncbi:methyltransferase domain-containing protein [Sulfitobacter sp. JBTF-M27]|uniref:Methyltransferase domain-containing protein n=1 Tax=Sulfitobacter sediminilitoris TaxID=2698830 RepID=A0A6P0CJV6_9RHOB|nr:methyltransferase regulatory domain-containing protein [Sulfitobacter sediminilitoris]NEK24793.1 methyltransferase domain-containing protein [Sulfitobacter sediminilitoris]
MSQWSSGYNTEIPYTYGYYRELSPNWLDYVATVQSIRAPSDNARYLELGCGFGFGLALMAALSPEHEFLGVDINPVHIAHGRKLVADAGLTNIRFEEADFIDLARDWPADWGTFNYVSAHGLFTWLSEPVRNAMIQTMKHSAAPGALVYLSYNTLPGCNTTLPLQHLLRLWQKFDRTQSYKAISDGISRMGALISANSKMTEALPEIRELLEHIAKQNRSYLAHEYLHDSWHPVWFDQLINEVSAAKLSYVSSARVGDFHREITLSQQQKEILEQYDDQIIREVMTDVLVNENFRQDVFARGKAPLWPGEQKATLLNTAFVQISRPEGNELEFKLAGSSVLGKAEVYQPLLEAFETGSKKVRELISVPGTKPRTLGDTIRAMNIMLHAGVIVLHRPSANAAPAKTLNRVIAESVAQGSPYNYLAAPQLGNVVKVSDKELIMFREFLREPAAKDPEKLARKLVARLADLGKPLAPKEPPVPQGQQSISPYAVKLADKFLQITIEKWKAWEVF